MGHQTPQEHEVGTSVTSAGLVSDLSISRFPALLKPVVMVEGKGLRDMVRARSVFPPVGSPTALPRPVQLRHPYLLAQGGASQVVWVLQLGTGQSQTLIPGKPPWKRGSGRKGHLSWTSTLTPHLSMQPERIPSVLQMLIHLLRLHCRELPLQHLCRAVGQEEAAPLPCSGPLVLLRRWCHRNQTSQLYPGFQPRRYLEGHAQEMSTWENRNISALILQPCSPRMNCRSPTCRNTQG